MELRDARISPQVYARIGGALYLLIVFFGVFGEVFVRGRLVVPGDPTATAERIAASELLWRAGIAGNLAHLSCAVALALVFFVLLRPVSRELALLAVLFNLVSIAIEATIKLNLQVALFAQSSASYLSAIDPEQRHVLAYLLIRSHDQGFGLALIFFGWTCLLVGYLIVKSGYLPKLLGVLMQVAGVCYLVNSFAVILSPEIAGRLFPWILLPAFVAETSFSLWLLVKGVDARKWEARIGPGSMDSLAMAGSR